MSARQMEIAPQRAELARMKVERATGTGVV